ncbi:nucleotidyltransferase domain-containing protein [Candidatus Woesearchaeota archaeon]|nr:nucleotidyltransferase domain-containing protein [Candidatus Woesearchaeota archaeon]
MAEFKIYPRENPVLSLYTKEDRELARTFAHKLYKEFGNFLKAVVIFGSAATSETRSPKSDIDVLVVVDDVTVQLSHEMIQTYRIIIEKSVVDVSPRLHVTTLRLTSFWEYVRAGDPVGINMLRNGLAILDTGFFDPLQMLLREGRIRPTQESVWSYYMRAPTTLHNSKWHIMQATLDLYWAAIDSAHAALMTTGEIPPSPDHVPDLLEEKFVKTKHLEPKYPQALRFLYNLSKMIVHREVKEIKGDEYTKYYAMAEDFVERMRKLVEKR